ncbi:hypothetical protein AAG906_041243 [Vitis piasezkii]
MGASAAQGDKYRSYLYGEGEENTEWRYGAPPDYDVIWPPGSLEEQVQNMVKTWEMEMFHKVKMEDFKSVDLNKYTFSLNERKLGGGYNPLLQTSLPEKFRAYNPDGETAISSHLAFTTAFPRGFALEILQVYSGPPVIVYKFRHWGYMEGPFKGHAPTGERIEVIGMAIFEQDEHSKIVKVEFFYDRGELLGGLLKAVSDGSMDATPSNCPVLRSTE